MFKRISFDQKCILLAFFVTCFGNHSLHAQVFVTPAGAGSMNGSSWANAYPGTQLQNMMASAAAGSQIWVAAGIYKPTSMPAGSIGGSAPRSYAFRLKNGVAVYGGFAGTETLLSQRNVSANVTILSGDIGIANNASDNCYHVVLSPANNSTAILDGFTIKDGNANGPNNLAISFNGGLISATSDNGAGMYGMSGGNPTVSNCIFQNNNAMGSGGALFQYNASAAVNNCTFKFNNAVNGGGSYHEACTGGSFINCNFSDNNAGYGGAVHTFLSTISFTDCFFTRDTATARGGAIYNLSSASPVLLRCTFSNNIAPNDAGGAVYSAGNCNAVFTSCDFSNNSSTYGGAIENYNASSAAFNSCNFLSNQSSGSGGAVANDENSNAQFTNCYFYNNSAADPFGGGGAVYNVNSSPVFTNCLFTQNKITASTGRGGAISNHASSPVVKNSVFWQNAAPGTTGRGGAVSSENGSGGQYANCLFWYNTSKSTGGGMYNTASSPTIVNCTFYQDSAGNGGGIQNSGSSSPVIFNTILWGNLGGGNQGINNASSSPNVTYSTVQGSLYSGTGNLNTDPLFVNPSNPIGTDNTWATADDGLMVQCMSPAADAGIAAGAPLTDIIGSSRPQGIAYDMGAYEQVNYRSIAADSIISSVPLCPGSTIQLTVAGGFPGANAKWKWYTGSCNGALIDSGAVIYVSPYGPTTYYVRAEGSCNSTACRSVTTLPPDSCIVLPVSFINFHLNAINTVVKLYWKVSMPGAVDRFEIERSADGQHFEKIGFVKKLNALIDESFFTYTDDMPGIIAPVMYYRVKMITTGLAYSFSKVLPVRRKMNDELLIVPNPVSKGTYIIVVANSAGIAELRILDVTARKLSVQKQMLAAGQNTFPLKGIENLVPGNYVLQLRLHDELVSKKMIIKR